MHGCALSVNNALSATPRDHRTACIASGPDLSCTHCKSRIPGKSPNYDRRSADPELSVHGVTLGDSVLVTRADAAGMPRLSVPELDRLCRARRIVARRRVPLVLFPVDGGRLFAAALPAGEIC